MGCGKAHFDRKGQKKPKIEQIGLKVCFLGPRWYESSYTTPQEAKEKGLVERYPPFLPGVLYSSFPIIEACLEFRAVCLKVQSRVASRSVQVASRSHVSVAWRSQGANFGTKIFNFRCFLALPDRNELYHTPLLSKIRGLGDRNLFVVGSLQEVFLCQKLLLIFCGYQNEAQSK